MDHRGERGSYHDMGSIRGMNQHEMSQHTLDTKYTKNTKGEKHSKKKNKVQPNHYKEADDDFEREM